MQVQIWTKEEPIFVPERDLKQTPIEYHIAWHFYLWASNLYDVGLICTSIQYKDNFVNGPQHFKLLQVTCRASYKGQGRVNLCCWAQCTVHLIQQI